MKRRTSKVNVQIGFQRAMVAALALTTMFAAWAGGGQSADRVQETGEGCLRYRSAISGRYELVPLIHTDAELDVRGLVATATVTQQYANSSTEPIEAVYVFPLPHGAAVYDLEIRIGSRVIRSEIHERQEAKRVYEAAKSEGKRAALLEEERPNIFTASVANIMPNDQITVRLRYVETVQWETDRMRLVFPMVVGPRYIPGTQVEDHEGIGWAANTNSVPDASRITPLVRNPVSRPGHDVSISVDLDSGFDSAAITSVSHEIKVRQLSNGGQRVELIGGATVPNKDFVLEVQEGERAGTKAALFLSPGNDSGETHFLLTAFPPTVAAGERLPVEMLYMIDVSGSMAGTSIEQAREALLEALGRLRPGDRFGILCFSNGYAEFAGEPLAATEQNVTAARAWVQDLRAGGGTEMLPALEHLMQKPAHAGYTRHIVLLTDGDLGNEEEIFGALKSDLGGARLYTVAIGSAPNSLLATKMAQYGRGTFTHIADIQEIQGQMTGLFEKIESPVLTDVRLSFEGVEVEDIYPQRIPDLFANQPLLVFGRIAKGQTGTMRLTARAGTEIYEANIAFDASNGRFHPGITTIWARQKVEELIDRWREADQDGRAEIRTSVIAHAIRYQLVTRFTSLVAVEETIVNAGGQSRITAVPTELPAGWQIEKVFGAPATGTSDVFFETLGLALLLAAAVFFLVSRKALALR